MVENPKLLFHHPENGDSHNASHNDMMVLYGAWPKMLFPKCPFKRAIWRHVATYAYV